MSAAPRRATPDDAAANELLRAMEAEIVDLYGAHVIADGPSAGIGEMQPPRGATIVLEEAGAAVAVGGIKRYDAETGEIKRMYVVPGARSRGHARRLLTALEATARELGYSKIRLDTGPRQPHAKTLYEGTGYRSIPDYNQNPAAAFWFEKEL